VFVVSAGVMLVGTVSGQCRCPRWDLGDQVRAPQVLGSRLQVGERNGVGGNLRGVIIQVTPLSEGIGELNGKIARLVGGTVRWWGWMTTLTPDSRLFV